MRKAILTILAVPAIALLGGCGRDPEQTAAVDERERRYGAEQHEELLRQFGGAYRGSEAQYLRNVGEKVAATAGLEGECTFSLVNSDVANAFAVPGCYIYLTRGLMPLMNSEDELAAVLAHELGHVVADHSDQQQQRSVLRELGVLAVALATDSQFLTNIAGGAAQLFTLRYSRRHEYEADEFAVTALAQSGYNPFAAAEMLEALGRYEEFHEAAGPEVHAVPEWGRTHPLTERRMESVVAAAEAAGRRPDELAEREQPFLDAIDGLLYGDDPGQGFVRGRTFAHPELRIAFSVPEGFRLTNSPGAVQIEGPGGLRGEFSGRRVPQAGLGAYSESILRQFGQAQVEVAATNRVTIDGLPALVHELQVQTADGSLGAVLTAISTGPASAYHFLLVAPPGARIPQDAMDMIASFQSLSPAEAARLRPRYIDVVTVPQGASAEDLARLMASDRPLEHFLVLNAKALGEPLEAGERVKIIRFGERQE